MIAKTFIMNQDRNIDEQQRNGTDDDTSRIYSGDNSTLQSPEEDRTDRSHHANENDVIETHTVEDVDIDAIAGSDRAGTNERKP